MRSNQSLVGLNNRRVTSTLGVSGMPLEWLDARSWRLPSGKALAEFALQTGFLAPLLFRSEPSRPNGGTPVNAPPLRAKALRKGVPR